MLKSIDFHGKCHRGIHIVTVRRARSNTHLFARKDIQDVTHESGMAAAGNLDIDWKPGRTSVAPSGSYQSFLRQARDVMTVRAMDRNTPTSGYKSDNLIGRCRLAAPRKHRQQLVHPHD